jgi:hypothetical protein
MLLLGDAQAIRNLDHVDPRKFDLRFVAIPMFRTRPDVLVSG